MPTERQEHLALMKWIRMRPHLEPYLIHIANEGRRDPKYGYLLKILGVKAGVSDFFLAIPHRGKSGLWIELKRRANYKVSPEQEAWIKLMRSQGYEAHVALGCENAIELIETYLLPAFQKNY